MPRQKSSPSRTISSGRLRIGDEWNAIEIIASTQTHPLKAICELAENALDAGAREVAIIRRRTHGELFLEVIDDGKGVARDTDGLPDFTRIATHVCDSMKRHLAEQDRRGIHGEFGIGLLSFWSLGEALRMVSAGADGNLYEMQLDRGNRTYTVRPVRGQLAAGGTRVIVGPLLPTTRNIVTGEKLQRYLSEELRDRIRNTRARVRILDHLSHRQLVVEPREFSGERLPVASRWPTPFGDVHAELYYQADGDGADRGVAVCKDGTRVLRNITVLEQFQHSPWSDARFVGVLDYGAFALAPGTRSGIVPDEHLMAFSAAVQEIESAILSEIAQREAAESDRASRDILRQVHRAFVSALRDLPSNEYLFFDIPE
ncbi:MAG: ATP-binding protein, partial [Deltaproteobacteria bacterium]